MGFLAAQLVPADVWESVRRILASPDLMQDDSGGHYDALRDLREVLGLDPEGTATT